MSIIQNNRSTSNQQELIKTEWIVLIGEALVAAGSIVVVIGLIRAFNMLIKESDSKK